MNSGEPAAPEPERYQGVEVVPNGPLLIHGDLRVKLKDGDQVIKTGTTAFCRCGGTAAPPYCDGTHGRIGFKDE